MVTFHQLEGASPHALPSPQKCCGLSPSPAKFFSGVKISLISPILCFHWPLVKVCVCRRQQFPDPGDLMPEKIRQDHSLVGRSQCPPHYGMGLGLSCCCHRPVASPTFPAEGENKHVLFPAAVPKGAASGDNISRESQPRFPTRNISQRQMAKGDRGRNKYWQFAAGAQRKSGQS